MRDKSTMDTRTKEQIQTETINSVCALQDTIELLFPWRIDQDENRVSLSNETIQEILKYVKQLRENK